MQVAQFALALKPFLNDMATEVNSLRQQEPVPREALGGAQAPFLSDATVNRRADTGFSEGAQDGNLLEIVSDDPGPTQTTLDRFLANVRQVDLSPASPDNTSTAEDNSLTRNAPEGVLTDIAWAHGDANGLSGPDARPLRTDGDVPASLTIPSGERSLNQLGDPPRRSQQETIPPAESSSMNDVLEPLRGDSHALADPASLFSLGTASSNGLPTWVLGTGRQDGFDSGRVSRAEGTGVADSARPEEGSWSSPLSGWRAESATGLNMSSGEALSDLTSRLLAATGRLEDAAQRLVFSTAQLLSPPPRRFRGRVDG